MNYTNTNKVNHDKLVETNIKYQRLFKTLHNLIINDKNPVEGYHSHLFKILFDIDPTLYRDLTDVWVKEKTGFKEDSSNETTTQQYD